MTRGWIKVDKEIYNGFARDKDKLRYMDLLLMSDHVPYQHKTKSGKTIEVKTGEFIVSQRQLAKRWKCRLEDVNALLHQLTEKCLLAVDKTDYHEQKYTFLDRAGNNFGRNDKRNNKNIVPLEQQNEPLTNCNSADSIVPKSESGTDKNDQVRNDKRNDYIIYKTNKTNNNNSAHVRTREEKKKFLDFIGLYNGLAEKAGSEYRIRATTPEREELYGALASKYDRATIAEAVQKSFSYPSIGLEWLLKEDNFIRILEGTYKSRNELKLKRNETIQDKRRGVEPLHKKDGGYRFK
jgi:hypothetical protein